MVPMEGSTRTRRTQRERRETTTAQLVGAARELFASDGYAATSLDAIVAAAGLTKGALYHHFRNKEQLFLEVYDQLEEELSARSTAAAASGTDPVDALRCGFAAFLDLALDPAVRRIALLDAPSVLGPATKLEVDARHSLAGVRAAVTSAIAAASFEPLDPDALAQLLIAACSQAALLIALADDVDGTRVDVGAALDRLITGLTP